MSEAVKVARPGVRDTAGQALLRRRRAAERRFHLYGVLAIAIALVALLVLLAGIVWQGYSAFVQHDVTLNFHLDPEIIDPDGGRNPEVLLQANYGAVVRRALRIDFPDVDGRRDKRALSALVSVGAADELRRMVIADPSIVGQRLNLAVPLSDDVDQYLKNRGGRKSTGRLNDRQLGWIEALAADGRIERRLNWAFFTAGDSREPEIAGVRGALMGSALTLLITLALALPIGVMTALYLEEFAPRNRWTDLIEVNINNLAAVPSIVFGLLGLTIFLGVVGLPRSTPLVGGLVLALMTLPTIVVSARAALGAVPPSIREAALGVGASHVQTVMHHVLPLALPGVLTGAIIGMSRALGETAPLLMIGMVAFITDPPSGFTDPATVLPVQIFLWADSPERAFMERTAAAILVLLAFLICMNLAAVLLRRRFERSW